MRKPSYVLFFSVAACLLMPAASIAGVVTVPEINPASAVSGLALVITSAALILERRRRR